MSDVKKNIKINEELRKLYAKNTEKHLDIWKECCGEKAPRCINEFGIIDVERYDSEEGILVIGRETNGDSWYKNDFDVIFTDWLREISKKIGILPGRPNIWYNTARYIMTVRGEKEKSLTCDNEDLLSVLGTIAFTNINKVGGGSSSGKAYWEMYKQADIIRLIVEEIEIIKPKYIILCDKYFAKFLTEKNLCELKVEKYTALKKCIDNNRLIVAYHPSARMSKEKMLNKIEKQLN